jgi:hypothetical protein
MPALAASRLYLLLLLKSNFFASVVLTCLYETVEAETIDECDQRMMTSLRLTGHDNGEIGRQSFHHAIPVIA